MESKEKIGGRNRNRSLNNLRKSIVFRAQICTLKYAL